MKTNTSAKMDVPASESSVSLKLEEIQKRCSKLLDEPQGLSELALEDAAADYGVSDPYNRKRVNP